MKMKMEMKVKSRKELTEKQERQRQEEVLLQEAPPLQSLFSGEGAASGLPWSDPPLGPPSPSRLHHKRTIVSPSQFSPRRLVYQAHLVVVVVVSFHTIVFIRHVHHGE